MTQPVGPERPGFTVFRLPRSHWHCGWYNFEWSAVHPPSLKERMLDFLGSAHTGGDAHMLLTGAPGVGKTHLGVAIYRAVAAHVGTELATWINVPTFCEQVKRAYGPDGQDPWPDYEGARRLVVLDDLFGRDLSQHEASQIIYRLIDTAYQNGAALLATMNQNIDELPARLAAHEISRLLAKHTAIPMRAEKDWRRG